MVALFASLLLHTTLAADCDYPPQPADGRVSSAWWSQYSSWCSACGGTPYQDNTGGGCRPGPNWGGRKSGGSSSRSGAASVPTPRGPDPAQQVMTEVLKLGINELFRQPTPEEQAASRQRAAEAEQRRLAVELERLRLAKEKSDRMDAEADTLLGLAAAPVPARTSDEDLLMERPPPPPEPFDCKGSTELAERLREQGLRRLDINIGKTQQLIRQAEEGKAQADREAVQMAAEVAAGKLADSMMEFAKNQETLKAMERQLQGLRRRTSVYSADHERLAHWVESGVTGGNGVLDIYEKVKAAKAFNFSDPANGPMKEQFVFALSQFNSGFMADTGAWELAGEHLSATLGPTGPVMFKTAVLGIKVAANRGSKMIAEGDLNEQKYHLGNMMKIRAELAHKIKVLEREVGAQCKSG